MAERDPSWKYGQSYPHSMDWARRVWVLQSGEILKDKHDNYYKVREVVRTFVPGSQPQIVLEEISDGTD
jgi:hypothetical protein